MLNDIKDEVVTEATYFVRIGKALYSKTSKKQDSSGRIASTVQKAMRHESKTIPKLGLGTVTTPEMTNNNITIKSLIDGIREDIIAGLEVSIKHVNAKLNEIKSNTNLKKYLEDGKELVPIFKYNTIDKIKIEAKAINENTSYNGIIRGVGGAILNWINEVEFYETLENIFRKKDSESNEDYIKMLQNYEKQRDKELKIKFESMNKAELEFDKRTIPDDNIKITPQEDAKKILAKIDSAVRLKNNTVN